jgi:DNA-binding MarR family transcriptional regulator
MKEPILVKIYDIADILSRERSQPRDYGIGHALYHSEVHLIMAIKEHPDANASELADALGITNGAITQVADKLERKGFIERYRLPDNRKDLYFRLTESGERAYSGHNAHHEKMNAKVVEYLRSLSESDYRIVSDFVRVLSEDFDIS